MPIAADLDHVALAAEHVDLLWPRYAGDLGGQWQGGGDSPGFYSAQVRFANGMKVEGLHPCRLDESDFLRRFLDQNGPGPHHLTFKVPDILDAIDRAERAGCSPVGVNLTDPGWQEAFLHPKQAHGIVVQLAQSADGGSWVPEPEPAGFPSGPVATLLGITHLVADLAAAGELFAGLLGGRAVLHDGGLELAWPGPGRLRLEQPEPGSGKAEWLGGRPGRLHHLAFAVDDPSAVAGAERAEDGWWEVPPAANLGTRLRLTPT